MSSLKKSIAVVFIAPFCAFAVDGVVLINQSTVTAAGGFPYTISQPGSYKLAGNLTVPDANTTGIIVAADNVTIDLAGFSIMGPVVCDVYAFDNFNHIPSEHPAASCSTSGTGVGIKAADRFLTCSCGPVVNFKYSTHVLNGNVSGMGSDGVILGPGSRVEHVTARSNGGIGFITGRGSVVEDNVALGNHGIGFFTGNGNVVRGNTAALNGDIGFEIFSGVIANNSTLDNGSAFPNNFIEGGEDPHTLDANANK